MMMFLSRLSQAFTDEFKSGWRNDIVVLMDGASYHRSTDTRTCINYLGIKVVLSAPYSYAAAPAELWFAHFKKGDFNPTNAKTGKR